MLLDTYDFSAALLDLILAGLPTVAVDGLDGEGEIVLLPVSIPVRAASIDSGAALEVPGDLLASRLRSRDVSLANPSAFEVRVVGLGLQDGDPQEGDFSDEG